MRGSICILHGRQQAYAGRNTWNIGDVGYIEGVTSINSQVVLVIVLGNKIINCFPSAVEVIED